MKSLGPALFVGVITLSIVLPFSCGGWTDKSTPPRPSVNNVVELSTRRSLLSPGTAVLIIKNKTGSVVKGLSISYRNRDSNQKKFHLVSDIAAFSRTEVGILESGWALEPNEIFSIHLENHEGATYKTFRADDGSIGFTWTMLSSDG